MLKRILMLILLLVLCASFTSCMSQNDNKEDEMNTPDPTEEKLAVEGINELHNGIVWDVSPNGEELLFSWDEDKPDLNPEDELAPQRFLYTINLANKTVTKNNHPEKAEYAHEGFASYSPDGKYIAFMENVEESFSPFLMENKDNAEKKAIEPGDCMASYPVVWSPDSNCFAIAYSGIKEATIVIYNASGEKTAAINAGNTSAYMVKPYFYDDDTLVFVKDIEIVYKDLSVQNSEVKTIAEGIRFAISEDKKHLAYTVPGDDGQGVIKITSLNSDMEAGTELSEVNANSAYETQLAWSPNSRYLLYTNGSEMWIINPETGDKLQLTSQESISDIQWVNDKEIVFTGMKKNENNQDELTLVIYQIVLS